MNHYSSDIQTVAYRTDRTILAGLEILIWDKIWTVDIKKNKYKKWLTYRIHTVAKRIK
jgi:hypothetical protein